jgi:type I restriction enzyme, S subunit
VSMSTWTTVKLGEICSVYDGPHATPKKTENGPIYLGIFNLSAGRLDLSKIDHLSEKDFITWIRRIAPRPGDVVFSYETRIGEAAIIPDGLRCCLGRRMGLLRPQTNLIDPRFLLYAYLGPEFQSTLHSRTIHGSTVDRISIGELPSYPISIPPLPIQRRIAEVLGRLDDKIEVNRRINRTLEQMAQALYKHWFVDFGPFQDGEFVESELGPIPKGWNVRRMGECVEAVKGLSYKGAYLAESGMPLHNLNSVYEGGGYKYEGIKYYTGEYKPRHIIQPGDVIVANTEQGFEYLLIGCPAIVPRFFGEKGLFSHHLFRLRAREGSFLSPYYLYCLLKDSQFRSRVTAFTNGTTVNMLSADGLNLPQIIVPSCNVSQRFREIIAPYFQHMEIGYEESQKLAEIRDYLLPKLLSGEIPVEAAAALSDTAANAPPHKEVGRPQQLALALES